MGDGRFDALRLRVSRYSRGARRSERGGPDANGGVHAIKLTIPETALVALVGASGSGKSTFAKKHFLSTEVVSSDACRGIVADDENDQSATKDAFDVLHYIAGVRLARGRLVVVDATNVQHEARKGLIDLARRHHVLPAAIVFNVREELCLERNRSRPERDFGPHVVRRQMQDLRRSLRSLQREGFRYVHVLQTPEEIDAAFIERQPLWTNKKSEHGPFDIIGDVHGCTTELERLLGELGYVVEGHADGAWDGPIYAHPAGRKAIFVGDLADRGPRILDAIKLVRNMVDNGSALCVPGNHDVKLVRALRGRDVQITHGLADSLAEFRALPDELRPQVSTAVCEFLDGLVSHYVLDEARLVVAHAGLIENLQGRSSAKVRDFAMYGETTGETDEFGLPVRYNWAAEYRGKAMVVYGHTPVPESEWLNNTINVDTGCVFGGSLTALRYPERALVSVPGERTYCEPAKPFIPSTEAATPLSAQQTHDDVLDIDDVIGKRFVRTRLRGTIAIREDKAVPALEVMSRFAVHPKWIIYLPPTMSPSETSTRPGLLEHPAEPFAYFRHQGVAKVICQEKHMGSRAVVIVGRDEDAIRRRFGIEGEGGICFTRTGRRFFESPDVESALLESVRRAATGSGLWESLDTDWLCLDAELMPWSAKAQDLLREQYAPVGSSGRSALEAAIAVLDRAQARGVDGQLPVERFAARITEIERYVAAYRGYCWLVAGPSDLKIAPFHLLATEHGVHVDKDHGWHMEQVAKLSAACEPGDGMPQIMKTEARVVDVTDEGSQAGATDWWASLTAGGGEGMVVKPFDFVARGSRGLAQPAVKCRGPEYLRIIYGPEYDEPEHLERLRSRTLGRKRSLALAEFALGIEALERFNRREPLRRVHECVFGVLAMESEAVDPRL
jgi:protein phosphatase